MSLKHKNQWKISKGETQESSKTSINQLYEEIEVKSDTKKENAQMKSGKSIVNFVDILSTGMQMTFDLLFFDINATKADMF